MKTKSHAAEDRLLFALFAILFFVFFRPMEALRLDVYNPDSACYADWLYRFFGGNFWNCKANYYYPGAALLWIPGAALGYLLGAITNIPAANWIEPLVGLTTFSAFCAAIWVNVKSLRILSNGPMAVALMLCLAAPVLPYATVHTFLSHSAEFLFTSLFLNQLLNKRLPGMLAFSVLTTLTRPTGVLTILLAAGFLLDDYLANKQNSIILSRANRRWLILAGVAMLGLLAKVAFGGYGSKKFDVVYPGAVLQNVNLTELKRFLMGDRNGMLITGPWWLALWMAGVCLLARLTWASRAVLAWMLVMGLLCIGWGGNGSQGGWFILYRYLTSTYLGAALLMTDLNKKLPQWSATGLRVLLGWQAAMICYVTWMNNYPVPKIWDAILGNAAWSEVIHKHAALAIFTPIPMTLFSWAPSLSRAVYGGEHFIAGPRLWILTVAVVIASFGLIRWLVKLSRPGKKLILSPA